MWHGRTLTGNQIVQMWQDVFKSLQKVFKRSSKGLQEVPGSFLVESIDHDHGEERAVAIVHRGHRVRAVVPQASTPKLDTRLLLLAADVDDDDELVPRVHHRLQLLHDGRGDVAGETAALLRVVASFGQASLQDTLRRALDVECPKLAGGPHAVRRLEGRWRSRRRLREERVIAGGDRWQAELLVGHGGIM